MFKLEFKTCNAAFDDFPITEAARILRDIADNLESGSQIGGGPARDANGNRVGWWEMTPFALPREED